LFFPDFPNARLAGMFGPGAYRGNEKQEIFVEDEDRLVFLDILKNA